MSRKVALLHAASYSRPDIIDSVATVLDAADLGICPGQKVLVKPNLLMNYRLACTNPAVTAAACHWLLDRGAQVAVADSPAFGTCVSVARAIGLTDMLKPLCIEPHNFSGIKRIKLDVDGKPEITVAAEALDCDRILSIPRVKAHSQVRITLAVKNCYGCIPGMRKAIAHSRFGQSVEYFTQCVAALWRQLPPVVALADGIIAMHITGPRNGKPYNLGLLAAGEFAPAVDVAVMKILNVPLEQAPLAVALQRSISPDQIRYPLEQPENFSAPGFEVPATLKNISFNPLVLAKSMARRLWYGWKKS